ncbi:MAG: tyrosine-type recombinase/integrase [Planctomycetes bacterium]|nr:tyrosine-type recombinase/integrase [Planctomycetota bacterium]
MARKTVNGYVERVRRMFKWAVENEIVPPAIHQALAAVPGLRYGRSEVRETDPIRPVADEIVNTTIEYVSPVVRSMVELQRVTGMRSSEMCGLRGCDLDTGGKVWVYSPQRHKTQHRGHARQIYFGPHAQDIIRPYLNRDLTAHLSSPAESDAWRIQRRAAARKTRFRAEDVRVRIGNQTQSGSPA